MITTLTGTRRALMSTARSTAACRPPQQGTSMRATVTLLTSLAQSDLGQLVGIVYPVELGAADHRHTAVHEAAGEVGAGKRRTIGRHQQVGTVVVRRLDRHELDLAGPLSQARGSLRVFGGVLGGHVEQQLPLYQGGVGIELGAGPATMMRATPGGPLAGKLHGLLVPVHGIGVKGGRVALHKVDGVHRACRQAVAQRVAIVVAQQACFAVHHADGVFVAGTHAQAAPYAGGLVRSWIILRIMGLSFLQPHGEKPHRRSPAPWQPSYVQKQARGRREPAAPTPPYVQDTWALGLRSMCAVARVSSPREDGLSSPCL